MPDVIDAVLSLQPIPGLQAVWKLCKAQLKAMAQSVAELLLTLNKAKKDRLDSKTEEELENLEALLVEITAWIKKQNGKNFLKSLYQAGDREAALEQYQKKLLLTIERFNLAALLSVTHFQQTFEAARIQDQNDLNERLLHIQRDQKKLAQALDDQQNNVLAMMISIQHALQSAELRNPTEKQFLKSSFNYLAYTSGIRVPTVESWTISSFDVEFEDQIGKGGFGKVYQGVWNHCPVALKVLQEDKVVPREAAIKREIRIWEKLRHPNLLQFLGANVLDDPPFIVMPYMQHGNAMDYLQSHPDINRTRILLQASRGLIYLHSQGIIHGDIKATNILMDDGLNAVLADFGLSRLKAEVASKVSSAVQFGNSPVVLPGGLYWMAPERIEGGPLQFASDVYSFGMTIYEVITCEIPLSSYPLNALLDAVVNKGLRPQRPLQPEDALAADMSDELWNLCLKCWVKDPQSRPIAKTVLKDLSNCPPSTKARREDISNVTSAFARLEVKAQPQTPAAFADVFTTLPGLNPAKLSRGMFSVTAEEIDLVDAVFKEGDPSNSGLLLEDIALGIFDRSGIPPAAMSDIWAFADEKNNGYLTRDETAMALRLMSYSREGHAPSKALLMRPSQPESLQQLKALILKAQLSDKLPLQSFERTQKIMALPDSPNSPASHQPTNLLSVPPFRPSSKFGQSLMLSTSAFATTTHQRKDDQESPWPISAQEKAQFDNYFVTLDTNNRKRLNRDDTVPFFKRSQLPEGELAHVWDLADIGAKGYLTGDEFAVAMYLIRLRRKSEPLPFTLPPSLIPPSQRSTSISKANDFLTYFDKLDPDRRGYIEEDIAKAFLRESKLPNTDLAAILSLANTDKSGRFSRTEFAAAMYLIHDRLKGKPIPITLPHSLLA
ncbi:kinase-like domain-containing protein [Flagelloscypha sp. PMI_526]|nr:kinase-like domain-containing protein [Flagelloscypha sp. PMI_526]